LLKSCKYCGRIHDSKYDCGMKPKPRYRKKSDRQADTFRSSRAWRRKREEIRQRDHNLCQCCIRDLPGTSRRLTYDDCSVHHAIPLCEDYSRRLDNDNLLTVCSVHHEMCENGEIPIEQVLGIIAEQEKRCGGCPPG